MPRIRVQFFAAVRERLECDEVPLDLPAGTTAADLVARLARDYPKAAPLLASVRVAANQEFVPAGHLLAEGDEVAIIPPLSGG